MPATNQLPFPRDTADPSQIDYDNGRLWGESGGELEFVGVRIEHRDGKPVAVLLLTDHDVQVSRDELEPGVHYRIALPLAESVSARLASCLYR